ncbi:sialate O-acetylesterase [Oleiharenicola lentus]|uniref:sialate O-acetylesterase n=1 Tax=Oleiharenicola lentus TaxID=2508720 RepID=UPI003F6610B3
MLRFFRICWGLAIALLGVACRADVTMAPIFADGMVLQRNTQHPVSGRADPQEKIEVEFSNQRKETKADAHGRWQVTLDPLPASTVPATLTVTGRNRVQLRDIVVGDVWLCSGQSNMEWAVATAANPRKEAAGADYPFIRHCKIARAAADAPAETVAADWQTCRPDTVLKFSAVAYFFARDQWQHRGVPIGIVTSAWGGTQIEAWTSAAALKSDPDFSPVWARWQKVLDDFPAADVNQNAAIDAWKRAAAQAKAAGQPFTTRRPLRWKDQTARLQPGGLFNGMIHPLVGFPFRGVLWFQGEANEFRPAEYGKLFRAMITQWRNDFARPELPFYFAQLANFATVGDASGETRAWLREAQGEALQLPHTGMVVTIDIGDDDDIHFKNKQEAGRRFSALVRANLDRETVATSGPRLSAIRPDGKAIRVEFAPGDPLVSQHQPPTGFEVAGEDRRFYPATAVVTGNHVIVSADSVPAPAAVRYAWKNTPEISLFNSAGLPVAPFRSDNWPQNPTR